MASLEYKVPITRWLLLRTVPGAWLDACRIAEVSPLHPRALALLFRSFVSIIVGRAV